MREEKERMIIQQMKNLLFHMGYVHLYIFREIEYFL
jgi:hypothetical protein